MTFTICVCYVTANAHKEFLGNYMRRKQALAFLHAKQEMILLIETKLH